MGGAGKSSPASLKSLLPPAAAKRTKLFAYGVAVAFLLFTAFLAFSPSSNANSPLFNSIFTSSSSFISHLLPYSDTSHVPVGFGKDSDMLDGLQENGVFRSGSVSDMHKDSNSGNGLPRNDEFGNGSVLDLQKDENSGNGSVPNGDGLKKSGDLGNGLRGNGDLGNGSVPDMQKKSNSGDGLKKNGDLGNGLRGNGELGNGSVPNGDGLKKSGDLGKGLRGNGDLGNGSVSDMQKKSNSGDGSLPNGDGLKKSGDSVNGSRGNGDLGSGSVPDEEKKHGIVSDSVKNSTVVMVDSIAKNQSKSGTDSKQIGAPEVSMKKNQTVSPVAKSNVTSVSAEKPKGNVGGDEVKKKDTTLPVSAIGGQKRDVGIDQLLKCDIFHGNWVQDDSYPLYPEGSCPHIDEPFDCYHNGRKDRGYQKLRWQPTGCNIPRLNGTHMLEKLRGKRLVFVGDSLNRNMWESLVCVLRNSVKDKTKVFEASGRRQFKTEGSYSFVFKDYGCTVEFFRSPFLVQEWEMPDHNGSKKETLRLDVVEKSAFMYKDAYAVIFNTGHWWTHDKTAQGKDYYQEGNHVYSELNVAEAFHKALNTWSRWVDANVNPQKTHVFFRGYSASHFSGGQWNSGGQCDKETEPIKNEKYLSSYPPKMSILEDVLKKMKTHVSYMNITRMTDYRKDAHPSVYQKPNMTAEERAPDKIQDCSHWCLPGVPDSWNELLYAQLLIKLHGGKH